MARGRRVNSSGEKSKNIIDKTFTGSSILSHQKIIYGKIKDGERVIDEVLISYFKLYS